MAAGKLEFVLSQDYYELLVEERRRIRQKHIIPKSEQLPKTCEF